MNALMLVHDGFEEVEALTAVDLLRRAGISVTVCSMTGKAAILGAHSIEVKADMVYSIDKSTDYDAVILPGGLPNAHTLRDDTRVIDLVKFFYRKGKIIGAICAAPCVLEKAGLLEGKKVTSYPGCLDTDKCGEYLEDKVVRDGNIITSRGVGTAIEFALEIIRALGLEDKAEKLAAQIMYN